MKLGNRGIGTTLIFLALSAVGLSVIKPIWRAGMRGLNGLTGKTEITRLKKEVKKLGESEVAKSLSSCNKDILKSKEVLLKKEIKWQEKEFSIKKDSEKEKRKCKSKRDKDNNKWKKKWNKYRNKKGIISMEQCSADQREVEIACYTTVGNIIDSYSCLWRFCWKGRVRP